MALRYSFGMGPVADRIEAAIAGVLASGKRTSDIRTPGADVVGTEEMGEAIIAELNAAKV